MVLPHGLRTRRALDSEKGLSQLRALIMLTDLARCRRFQAPHEATFVSGAVACFSDDESACALSKHSGRVVDVVPEAAA